MADKIRIGCIGVGGMGTGNMNKFMQKPEVEVVAVCDVDADHLADAQRFADENQRPGVANAR